MDERRATVEGIDMRWLEEGAGPPVVLIHGIPTSPELWRHVVPRVEGATVLAWEMVGYGESMAAGVDRDISVARQTEYLGGWLKQLGVERAILVGHDLGGGVAQILAVRRPELAAGLVLTNSIGYDSWPIPSAKAMRAVGGLLRHFPSSSLAAMLRVFLARGHDDHTVASESADIHLPRYARSGGSEAFVRQIRSLNVQDTLAVEDALPGLDLPAALAWGEADRFQKIEYGERFERDLGATLDRVSGGKHFLPEDHPEAVARAVNRVIADVLRRRGRMLLRRLYREVLGLEGPVPYRPGGSTIRPLHYLFTAAVLGVIVSLPTACVDEPAPPTRLGPRDGTELPPIEPERVAVGDTAPDFSLRSHGDEVVTLSDYRGERDIVLVFYRGHW